MRQRENGEPRHVSMDANGLTLTLQCVNPSAEPDEHQWGLQGINLNAATWYCGLPSGMSAQQATAKDEMVLFELNLGEVAEAMREGEWHALESPLNAAESA